MVELTHQQWQAPTAGGAPHGSRAVNWRLLIAIGLNLAVWSVIFGGAQLALG